MRVLSIGFPLPDPQVDNYDFLRAPCFFDYDALVVRPSAVSDAIEDVVHGRAEHRTLSDQPVVNGPGDPQTAGLADLLRQRAAEASRLLARGGLIVLFAEPDAAVAGVDGFAGCHRYYWLPAPKGLTFGPPHLVPGHGSAVPDVDAEHPFAPFVTRHKASILYRAHFELPKPASGATVFARSEGGAAVGVELPVGGGRVVALPALRAPPTGTERYRAAAVMVDCVRRALGASARGPAPSWASRLDLPDLEDLRSSEREAARKLAAAAAAHAEARAGREGRERFRQLLWQDGKLGLEAVVRDAFRLLGFDVTADLDQPAEIATRESPKRRILLEVEAALEAVDLAPHHRLRRRLEEALEKKGGAPQGLIVVNGYRLQAPGERPLQASDALRAAAERMRYGLITTADLFEAVRAALAGDEPTVAVFRERLLRAEGAPALD